MLDQSSFKFYVYMLTNKKNGTLYIGMTNNLERRVLEHKIGLNDGFTKKYSLTNLVYYEEHKYINNARERERPMKKWLRKWKIELIERENPNWIDLSKDWYSEEELIPQKLF